jgi:amino-acid N-acetyltransferase
MHIRPATEDDAEAVKGLIDEYVPTGALLPRAADFVAAFAHDFVVAEAGGRVVGCVHLDEYAPSLAEVRSLAVAPGHQGGGIGRALLESAENLARVRAYATLFAVSNDEAFFRRHGFEARHIPELDRERSEVSRYKGVYAKDLPR